MASEEAKNDARAKVLDKLNQGVDPAGRGQFFMKNEHDKKGNIVRSTVEFTGKGVSEKQKKEVASFVKRNQIDGQRIEVE